RRGGRVRVLVRGGGVLVRRRGRRGQRGPRVDLRFGGSLALRVRHVFPTRRSSDLRGADPGAAGHGVCGANVAADAARAVDGRGRGVGRRGHVEGRLVLGRGRGPGEDRCRGDLRRGGRLGLAVG